MLRTYKFIETNHQKLHENVMSFFDRIEFETGEFSITFFDSSFYENIAKHHLGILVKPLEYFYNEIKTWPQDERSNFIRKIRESNDVNRICKREVIPLSIDEIPQKIKDKVDLKKMYNDLYSQILQGDYCSALYGTLQSHFKELRKAPNDFLKCPACGLETLKTGEETKNQYDHYLHKSKYILSSVNFNNLVPICTECNSYNVKHDHDILEDNFNRRIFFPYDETHQGINISACISNDNGDIENIDFDFTYSTKDHREEEVKSWITIFKIESRYKARAKGAAIKWYKNYWHFKNKPKYQSCSDEEKKEIYIDGQDEDELDIVKIPVLNALDNSTLAKAEIQMRYYSMDFS